jgi:hypothetical protein
MIGLVKNKYIQLILFFLILVKNKKNRFFTPKSRNLYYGFRSYGFA